jgi:hypothetical protein
MTYEGYATRCPLCRDTGVVAIYGRQSIDQVRKDRPMKCAIRSAVVCTCSTADARFGKVESEGMPVVRYEEGGYCPLPHLGYVPNVETVHQDYKLIRDWLDTRRPRVGTFSADDWGRDL